MIIEVDQEELDLILCALQGILPDPNKHHAETMRLCEKKDNLHERLFGISHDHGESKEIMNGEIS